jgi:2-octaprenylphenol hydroxylase
MPAPRRQDFDVVIVGGGMVGSCLAGLIARDERLKDWRIALVEPTEPRAPQDGEVDLRVSAISRASQRILQAADAWSPIPAGACPYSEMIVWDAAGRWDGRDALRFSAAEIGEPDLGHIGENLSIQAALTARAEAQGVVLLRAELATMQPTRDAMRVSLGDGREFQASLVVGADGAESAVRRMAGIDTRGWDYGQRAVVAHLASEVPHGATARQRFLDTGPLALLPLADGRSSLVWSTLPEQAEELTRCPEEAFAERVTAASAGVLGRLVPTTARVSFPLRLLHAHRYAADRIVLVGDAAHAVHPLAGQGINIAFLDAAALVDVLGDALEAGDDPGELGVLRRYERWRKAEALPAIAMLDGLKRLFSGGNPLQSRLRQGALGLAQSSVTAKRLLMQRALGVAGELPASVRLPPS